MTQAKASRGSKHGHIVRDPSILGGEPAIRGTRVPVSSIVIERPLSKDEDRVRRAFPRLEVQAIREALGYYEAHREEIDRLIEENEQAASGSD